MARKKERLYLRFRDANGKQSPYCPALYDKKSRLRSGWCLVRGVEEYHSGATYYQRVKRSGKWVWESRGTDPATAFSKSASVVIGQEFEDRKPKPEPVREKPTKGFRVDDEITTYLSNVAKLAPKTYKAYKLTLDLFRQSCNKQYMHEITKQDLQAFDSFLLERGHDDRTRHNRIGYLVTFLRNKQGRRLGSEILNVSIKVKFMESQPEAYTRQELQDLFQASNDDDKFLWRFLLGTGFREGEAAVAEKSDINQDTRSIRVAERVNEQLKEQILAELLCTKNDSEWREQSQFFLDAIQFFEEQIGTAKEATLSQLKSWVDKHKLNSPKSDPSRNNSLAASVSVERNWTNKNRENVRLLYVATHLGRQAGNADLLLIGGD